MIFTRKVPIKVLFTSNLDLEFVSIVEKYKCNIPFHERFLAFFVSSHPNSIHVSLTEIKVY